MKFSYKKKRLRQNLLFGIGWLFIGLVDLFFSNEHLFGFICVPVGILYSCIYYFENKYQYVEVTDEKVVLYTVPKKEIYLNDLKEVNFRGSTCTLKSSKKKIRIFRHLINKEQIRRFDELFGKMSVALEKVN